MLTEIIKKYLDELLADGQATSLSHLTGFATNDDIELVNVWISMIQELSAKYIIRINDRNAAIIASDQGDKLEDVTEYFISQLEEITAALMSAGNNEPVSEDACMSALDLTMALESLVVENYHQASVLLNKAKLQSLQGYLFFALCDAGNAMSIVRKAGAPANHKLAEYLLELARLHVARAAEHYGNVIKAMSKDSFRKALPNLHASQQILSQLSLSQAAPNQYTAPVIQAYIDTAASELQSIIAHPCSMQYKELLAAHPCQHSIPTPSETEIQSLLQNCDFTSGHIETPADCGLVIEEARTHLKFATKYYIEATTIQSIVPRYAEAAKRELEHLLKNPYVIAFATKLTNAKDAKLEEVSNEQAPPICLFFNSAAPRVISVNSLIETANIEPGSKSPNRPKQHLKI